MTQTTLYRRSIALLLSLCSFFLAAAPQAAHAQATGATVTGTITDIRGDVLQTATVAT